MSGSSPAQQTTGREAGLSGGSRVGYAPGPYAAAHFLPKGSGYLGTSPTHNKKKPLLAFFPDLLCEFVFQRDFVGPKCVWRGRASGSGLAGLPHSRVPKTFASN